MKYAGPYYARLHNLSKAHSNMNLLCMSLERWERGVRWRKEPAGSFDWHIMYDPEVSYDQAVFDEIEAIFLDFNKCRKEQLEFEKKCRNWQLYHKDIESRITKEEAKTYETNWQAIYNIYRNKCKLVCPDVRKLANILVVLCYEKYPNKFKKFCGTWPALVWSKISSRFLFSCQFTTQTASTNILASDIVWLNRKSMKQG